MTRLWVIVVSAVWILLAATAFADTGLARHKKLYAVPAPGKVVIDGKLDDWDLSGQIFMYVVSETSDMQSARFAMMYDDEALYISGVVRDPSPMMNRHDPNVDPEKAWDADVCQIYMVLDPSMGYPVNKSSFNGDVQPADLHDVLVVLHRPQGAEPGLYRGMMFDQAAPQGLESQRRGPAGQVPGRLRQGRRRPRIYLRVSHSLDDAGRPATARAGDVTAGTVQFCWSTPDGFKTAGGSAWGYDVMAGPGFIFQTTSCWGKMIFSDKGQLPKEMVDEGLPPEQPLPLSFTYDLPEDGEVSIVLFDEHGMAAAHARWPRPRAAQDTTWSAGTDWMRPANRCPPAAIPGKACTTSRSPRSSCSRPTTPGQPPYKTDDNTGGWGGDHGCPTSACAAGDGVILAWNMSESGWGIIRTDLTGKKQWGIKHNAEDLAADGERLLVVGDNGFNGAESVQALRASSDGRPLNWGNGKPALDPPPGGDAKTNVARAVA